MPATYDTDKLRGEGICRLVDFDPDAGTEVLSTLNPALSQKCLPIALHRNWLFGIMRSVGTGGITLARIIAATNAAGANATTIVSKNGTPADAVGDHIWLEADADQVNEVLPAATHIGLGITLATATDECVVFVRIAKSSFSSNAMTVDYIS